MRSAVGRRLRTDLFRRIPEALPGFTRLKKAHFSRELWGWQRVDGPLLQWIWYQQDRHEDKFTLEVSWSLASQDPFHPQLTWPFPAPFTPSGQRLRLGTLFTKEMDYWWLVSDPLPDMLDSPEAFVETLMKPRVYSEADTTRRIAEAVNAAEAALRTHAAPYFEQVRAWAARVEHRRPGG